MNRLKRAAVTAPRPPLSPGPETTPSSENSASGTLLKICFSFSLPPLPLTRQKWDRFSLSAHNLCADKLKAVPLLNNPVQLIRSKSRAHIAAATQKKGRSPMRLSPVNCEPRLYARRLRRPKITGLRSEGELASYLDDAGSSLECRDEIGRTNVYSVRHEQICMIEDIVKFSAKLKGGLLTDPEAFVNAEIKIPETRSAEEIAPDRGGQSGEGREYPCCGRNQSEV